MSAQPTLRIKETLKLLTCQPREDLNPAGIQQVTEYEHDSRSMIAYSLRDSNAAVNSVYISETESIYFPSNSWGL